MTQRHLKWLTSESLREIPKNLLYIKISHTSKNISLWCPVSVSAVLRFSFNSARGRARDAEVRKIDASLSLNQISPKLSKTAKK